MGDERYPIGQFAFDKDIGMESRGSLVTGLASQSGLLAAALSGLTEVQLDTPYRAGGWTPRQLAHHVADASLSWYLRIKLGLTEEKPRIVPFDQDRWSELVDARSLSPQVSVGLLEAVHARIVTVLRAIGPQDFRRTMIHPERGEVSVDYGLQYMHWHTRHHTEQIRGLRRARGW